MPNISVGAPGRCAGGDRLIGYGQKTLAILTNTRAADQRSMIGYGEMLLAAARETEHEVEEFRPASLFGRLLPERIQGVLRRLVNNLECFVVMPLKLTVKCYDSLCDACSRVLIKLRQLAPRTRKAVFNSLLERILQLLSRSLRPKSRRECIRSNCDSANAFHSLACGNDKKYRQRFALI